MASNHEFPGPWGYAVPFRDRSCPEHTFHVKENLKKKKPDDYPHIWMIFHALLNSIGGILILESTQTMESLERDEWLQRCKDFLQYLPSLILSSIGYKILGSTITMFIPRYSRKLPYNLCLSVRNFTGNQKFQDLELLQTVMKRKSESPSYLNLAHQYNHGEEFPHDENQNREYKGWNIKLMSELVDHIACTTSTTKHQKKMYEQSVKFQKTLLAMANEIRGGELILGIREDQKDKKLKVIGTLLEDSDRPEFEDVIENVLRADPVTGEPRVWCEPGIFPEKGRHWHVTYHEVIHPGHMKLVLIRIQIDHFPGGVFEVEPSIFDINSDGFIIKMPFIEWKQYVLNRETPFTAESLVSRESAGNGEDGATGGDADGEEGATGGDADDARSSSPEPNASVMDRILQFREGLSWTGDKKNWSQNLGDISEHVEDHISGDSTCFDLQRPFNFTPQRKTLICRHQHNLEKNIKFIETYHDAGKGFVISGEPWLSFLSESLVVPSSHILDLLVFVYTGHMHELHLWTIIDSTNPQDLWEYTLHCGLLFKQRLMDCQYLNISVICHSLSLSDEHHTTSGHEEYVKRHLCSESENTLDNVRESLAGIMYKKNTSLMTYLGEDALIQLSEKQIKGYIKIVSSDIAFVKGPPGSGKTVLATCIAKHFNDVVYVCTNKSFEQYIKSQFGNTSSVRCHTRIAESGEDLKTIIKSKEVKLTKCLISDDIHNLECSREVWREAVKDLIKQGVKAFLFADPFIQEHAENHTTDYLEEVLREIQANDPGVAIAVIPLTENHRNSRKVASFMKTMVKGTPGENHIKSLHSLDGDDIEVWKGKNLYVHGKTNGLLKLFHRLFDGGNEFSYEAHQMALILTGKFATEYKPFFMKLLTDNLPCEVQGADNFPKTGLQVDVDSEYCGLEVPLAIVLHPRKKEEDRTSEENQNADNGISEEHWMNDPRLLAFLASRGTLRVIFVVEELNFEVFQKMKLDTNLLKKRATRATLLWWPPRATRATLLWWPPWPDYEDYELGLVRMRREKESEKLKLLQKMVENPEMS